jgi:hypothetical protein
MAYQILNETTILDYVKRRPLLAPLLASLGAITAREVGQCGLYFRERGAAGTGNCGQTGAALFADLG